MIFAAEAFFAANRAVCDGKREAKGSYNKEGHDILLDQARQHLADTIEVVAGEYVL